MKNCNLKEFCGFVKGFNPVLWGLSTTQRTSLSGLVWGLAGKLSCFDLIRLKIGFQLYSP